MFSLEVTASNSFDIDSRQLRGTAEPALAEGRALLLSLFIH